MVRRRAILAFPVAALASAALAGNAAAHHPRIDPWTAAIWGPDAQRMLIGGMQAPKQDALTGPSTPTAYDGCGPDAIPETGIQGQVPAADQQSGRSKRGYRCNLRLVGSNDIMARGANFQLGWYRNCAYVGIVGNQPFQGPSSPETHPLEGVAVIDVSNPRSPRVVRILQSPMGRTQHEAVEVNEARGMLVVQTGGLAAQWVEIYDASEDCTNPVFKGRYDNGIAKYHGQRISPDGRTVYVSDTFQVDDGPVLDAIDVSDMTDPQLIKRWDPREEPGGLSHAIHDLDVSPDGRTLYLGDSPRLSNIGTTVAGPPTNYAGPSMTALDVSDIQDRRPNPDPKVVGIANLINFGHTEGLARINGKPYVFSSGEAPVVGGDNCPWAWGHVLDMSDPTQPREVAEIKLDVNEVANCPRVAEDDAVYSIHYIGFDDPRDATKVFYSYYTGGLRVFDIREPSDPKEIAYYHPPPMESTVLQPISPFFGDRQTPEWDSVTSDIRYVPETGHIWMVSIGRGFQVLEGAARGGGLPGDACSKGPRASISRDSLRPKGGGLKMSGRAVAFRCLGGELARGTVRRVEVFLARRVRGGCRFLKGNGRFGSRRSCSRPGFLRARLGRERNGKVPWSYRTGADLAPGRYIAGARATDSAGRVSSATSRWARRTFRIR